MKHGLRPRKILPLKGIELESGVFGVSLVHPFWLSGEGFYRFFQEPSGSRAYSGHFQREDGQRFAS